MATKTESRLTVLQNELNDAIDTIESLNYDITSLEVDVRTAEEEALEAQVEVRVLRSVLELAAGSSAVKVVAASEE